MFLTKTWLFASRPFCFTLFCCSRLLLFNNYYSIYLLRNHQKQNFVNVSFSLYDWKCSKRRVFLLSGFTISIVLPFGSRNKKRDSHTAKEPRTFKLVSSSTNRRRRMMEYLKAGLIIAAASFVRPDFRFKPVNALGHENDESITYQLVNKNYQRRFTRGLSFHAISFSSDENSGEEYYAEGSGKGMTKPSDDEGNALPTSPDYGGPQGKGKGKGIESSTSSSKKTKSSKSTKSDSKEGKPTPKPAPVPGPNVPKPSPNPLPSTESSNDMRKFTTIRELPTRSVCIEFALTSSIMCFGALLQLLDLPQTSHQQVCSHRLL
jgi:hypothetical protein